MAKLVRVGDVSVFTRDGKRARKFYTEKVGLKVRSSDPKLGYFTLGATKGGGDAGLSVWQPGPEWGTEMYEDGMKSVGTVTGIGFRTSDLEKTVRLLRKRRVKVEKSSDTFARFWDADGNVLFLEQQRRPKARRAGLQMLEFVTVVSRDAAKSGEFFKALGFKGRKVPGEEGTEGESFTVYQLRPRGTAIMPFTPVREMYENPTDYDADMAHVGEWTGIGIEVEDIYDLQEELLAKGVRFKAKAERREWGAVAASVFDPDENSYMLFEMP